MTDLPSGPELRTRRLALGLEQRFVATTVLGFTPARLHAYEVGKRQMPLPARRRLVVYFDVVEVAQQRALARALRIAA